MKLKIALYAVVIALVLSMPSCVKSTVITTPTSQPPVADTPGVLVIASTNAFIDSTGTYHVVGQVDNNSSTIVNSIQLAIEIKDITGNSLLKDDNGNSTPNAVTYPMLYTLAPGEASPFEYSYDTTNGTPDSFNVTISGQATGEANRASLHWENVQIADDSSGRQYLTGKLVNTGSQWARISGLAGAVLDDSNKVLSAAWTSTYTTELAPAGDALGRDRTPFEINFPKPEGATHWQIYWDADGTDNVTDYPMEIKVSNTYFDQFGSARIVGWITNNFDQPLDSLVVAGLYAADGTVLDSSYAFVPVPARPGEAAPFSISSFSRSNYTPDEAALVTTSTTQFDTGFTFPSSYEAIDLSVNGETVQKDGATWIFSGSVTNTSDRSLGGATVVVMVMDSQNKLVAMEYTSIYPTGDAIAAGESNTYSVSVYLNPVADASGFTTTTMVIGIVK